MENRKSETNGSWRHILAEEWISVGDNWGDSKVSAEVNINFLSYQGDVEKMNKIGVFPSAEIMNIRELVNYIQYMDEGPAGGE